MSGTKISVGADPGTLVATDKLPLARSASTTAYAATMAEVATYANGAYVPPYYASTPAMDGTGAAGASTFVSRGDHVHPSDISRAPLASPTFTGVPAAPTPTTGTNTTQLATTAFVQSQMVASGAGVSTWNTRAGAVVLQQADIVAVGALHDVGRNLIHNPLFNVAQRGAGPWSVSGNYTADRWFINLSGDTVAINLVSFSDASRAQIGDEAAITALQNGFAGNAAVGSYEILIQPIENVRRLAGKTVTVSFWAAASVGAPKLGVSIDQAFGSGGAPSANANGAGQAVTLSTTWTRYSLTFAIPSASGKTLGTNGNSATLLDFWFSAEATFSTRSGGVGVQSATVFLWGVQLEVGSVATPLEKPDPRYDLANCQRFYCNFSGFGVSGWSGVSSMNIATWVTYPVAMRATPTLAFNGSGAIATVGSVAASNSSAVGFTFGALSNAIGYAYWNGSFTASADL